MTNEDWKEVEQQLQSIFSHVELKCDGYKVALVLKRLSQMKNGIIVYVNGIFEYKWLLDDCEERRRFCCPVKKSVYNQKHKAAMKKISKRLRGLQDPEAKYTYYLPYWSSFRSLKSHLIKNNSSIELIREKKDGE
ncbi:hypothetical protein SAMN05660649_04286 [Desulfotomaculum arcticum]|uniref:Uncharacterized protein n=1 Tax=Desulfotruncus arcticus DSM 17038 TaxID=1121424 RepID=A0A1I2Y7M0_9FIRM|nr:hypothetical protein SAMN05660649_04286 [Desulfotomaculum arcticum] [Desulfotruncus arcticus DSM 17038]